MEGVLFLITILRPVNFLSICRCSSPYHKDGILVLSAPGKGPFLQKREETRKRMFQHRKFSSTPAHPVSHTHNCTPKLGCS